MRGNAAMRPRSCAETAICADNARSPCRLLALPMAFDAFALILALLFLGIVFARLKMFPANASETLNGVVLYLCLPAAILLYVPRLHVDASLAGLIATPWLLIVATVLLVTLCGKLFGFRKGEHAALLMCVGLGNTSFIGYPMIRALLGDEALPDAVVYDQLGTFLLLSTYGLYVCARYAGDAPPSFKAIALRVAKFPPCIALLLALTVMPADPPHWIAAGLQRLSDAMLPLVMVAVGLSIKFAMPRDELKPLLAGIALKLVVMPLLALGLALLFHLSARQIQVSVLQASMPCMISAAALAMAHNLAPRLCAALVGYSLVASLVTLPAWMWLLQHFI